MRVALLSVFFASFAGLVQHGMAAQAAASHKNNLKGSSKLSSRGRQLQEADDTTEENSPCAIPLEDAVIDSNGPSFAQLNFKPSYVAACLRSLEVDKDLMTQHIQALRRTFEQYYVFYNLMNDQADSDPFNYQPDLGYTIFAGPNEGQVNLEEELTSLIDQVSNEGASLATFWDVQTIFFKMYDAHVYPLQVSGQAGDATSNILPVFPGRNFNNATAMKPHHLEPSYNEEGELELKISFEETDGNLLEETIVSINGKTPYDFYFDLITNPALGYAWPYQSVGARMNGAFVSLQPLSEAVFVLECPGQPADVLPDSFPVVYASGEEETYYVGAFLYQFGNASTAYEFFTSNPTFDAPGPAYKNFQVALGQIENVTSEDVSEMIADPFQSSLPQSQTKAGHTSDKDSYEFDQPIMVIDLSTGAPKQVGAFKITDEFAVLKLWDFEFFPALDGEEAVPQFWSNFTAAAKAKGVKKAMIDISQNGGGVISSGDALSISMYPFAPYEVFQDIYDVNYNDVMLAFNQSVLPLLETLDEVLENNTDADLQEFLETQLDESTGDQLEAIIESLLQFCCNGNAYNASECPNCARLETNISEPLATLREFPNGPQLRDVLTGIFDSVQAFNPFTVLGISQIDPDESYEVVRGGVTYNLTNKFTGGAGIITEADYYKIVAQTFQNDWLFDEYVLVSDGAAGSTTSIFSMTVMQLWNNRDTMWNGRGVPPAPLTTVTYGGAKVADGTTTVSGFPASVQEANIGTPIITAGLMLMLQFLLPSDEASTLQEANEHYTSVLAVPPYFAEVLPTMPVFNFYSNFMDPGAAPLMGINNIFSDRHHHIRKVFTGITIEDSSDLEMLYWEAAALGFSPPEAGPNGGTDSEDMTGPIEQSEDATLTETSKNGGRY